MISFYATTGSYGSEGISIFKFFFSGCALECQRISTEQGCSLIEHVGVVQQCTAYAIGGR